MLALLFSVLIPLLLTSFLIKICFKNSRGTTDRLPPGPRPVPVIGSLHLLTTLPHRAVAGLSKAYGPIMLLRLGSTPTVFISSPRLAEQVFKALDPAFAARPFTEAAGIFSYGGKDMIFADYGPRWRKLRKLCINNLLATAKLDSYGFVRREEVANFVGRMQEVAQARAVADVTTTVRSLVADMVCRIVMGRKCMEESMDGAKFSEHMDEIMRILGSFNLNDAVPLLAPLDLHGLRRRTKAVMRRVDKFLDKIIDDHTLPKADDDDHDDFIDVMLHSTDDNGSALDRTSAKAVILDMFLGALDTSPITIDWALVELLRHPPAMKKAREELERVVGLGRAVEESDVPKLPYLAMVIKETFRLHQVGPFVFRHAKEGAAVDGYRIPVGTDVMICVWAMCRDPSVWENAEEFIPERFDGSGVDVRGHDFELLPFGSGRRICPGMNFALATVPLVLAQLVHCFDWELPAGMSPSELDMMEDYGFTLPRAAHLHATPIYRLVHG